MTIDVVLCAAVFFGVIAGLDAVGFYRAGTTALLAALAVATWRLWASGQSWIDVGFHAPIRWWHIPAGVVGSYMLIGLGTQLIVAPLANVLHWAPQDFSRLGLVRGDMASLFRLLLLAWTTAAFGEEMLFRGFFVDRLESVFGGGAAAALAAVLVQAMLFGAGHAYLGARGAANAAVVGVVLGAVYFALGRNLWPLIAAHATIDTVSLVALYVGVTERLGTS